MGVEEIIAVIAREAGEEAARIVAAAEQQARDLVADAEAEVQVQVDAAVERLGPEIRAASQRRVNAVRLRILEQRARDDAARLMDVFDAAEQQVTAIANGADPPRWSAGLARLCADGLRSVGEGAAVQVRERDVRAISRLAEAEHAEVVALPDDAEPGLIVASHDGRIVVDARLPVRLERARSLLAEAVAQQLDLERSSRGPGSAV